MQYQNISAAFCLRLITYYGGAIDFFGLCVAKQILFDVSGRTAFPFLFHRNAFLILVFFFSSIECIFLYRMTGSLCPL
jgi:hypothetical protein